MINNYQCENCDFEMPRGWGGYMYVQAPTCVDCDQPIYADDKECDGCNTPIEAITTGGYERITCPHPQEHSTVVSVLGPEPSDELVDQRTGFNSYCVCLSCLSQFELDLGRDDRKCPECMSIEVKSEHELVDELCPKCSEGTFVEISTGIIS